MRVNGIHGLQGDFRRRKGSCEDMLQAGYNRENEIKIRIKIKIKIKKAFLNSEG